ncbi:uncharacterized protein ACLA_043120 [Aspergillus clavatus NRRL 1]|uniref:Uncharacterized protein n=1 Tax=Aspergillus clavatus (strain ATCC 1007 / CBS 513.65 / DSM 816 / NCTC 3887 / NRRL 1 / QM 1276 / 107) TaxID=344612 RepID=A1C8F7_ASPCL|nr:uncharacterized protein ACLA_043120 [Aspergillus clavatus NRRL 1]EAW13594.1 hypothetical protein ACLA_043120 [Aspergillus clavatus NRRL 1]
MGSCWQVSLLPSLRAGIAGRFRFEMQDPKQQIHIADAVTAKPVEGMHLKMSRIEGW